jgi:alanine transaminase
MDVVVNPPMPGDPSYEQYVNEKKAVLNSLAERAKMVAETFNSIEGVSCNEVQGAMYAFPKVKLFILGTKILIIFLGRVNWDSLIWIKW